MNGKLERIVQLRQSNQKDHCPVPGIHLKVEQDLQIIQDGVFDIVRFINDDHRSFPFIQRKTVDLLLDDMKVFCFAVGSLRTKRHGKIPVEVIHCNRGEAGIDHLIQRRIQPVRRTLSRFTKALSCLLRRRIGVREPSLDICPQDKPAGIVDQGNHINAAL